MATNISNDYVNFVKKSITNYTKIIMEKNFNKEIFDTLLNTYINTRYYNYYDSKYKNYSLNINYYLKDEVLKLMQTDNQKYNELAKKTYLIFKYIIYFDNVLEYDSLDKIVDDIIEFRIKNFELYSESFAKEFTSFVKEDNKRKKTYLESLKNDKLILTNTKTNKSNVFFANLLPTMTFPKIYSNYSINKVYNEGIINEDKLFITYHLVNKELLLNAIKGIYDIKYIVDFPLSILEKKDKTTRLLNTINSEITRDNVIMNITYSNYLNNKESIESMIKDGYKFSVILDDKYDYQEKSKIWLSIFSYIILDKDTPFDCEKEKIIIKK